MDSERKVLGQQKGWQIHADNRDLITVRRDAMVWVITSSARVEQCCGITRRTNQRGEFSVFSLQLSVKKESEELADFSWRIVESRLLDYPSERGMYGDALAVTSICRI